MNINKEYISAKNTTNGKTNAKKYIVIHETDNFRKGANAKAHAKAQYNGNLQTSVHFYCGSDGIYQAADLDKCVWAVGNTYLAKRPIMDADNYNTINIEICVNEDGIYDVARQNAIELTKHLMSELGLGADRVIRHYDAKGKYCPRKMLDNPTLWEDFKEAIQGNTNSQTTSGKQELGQVDITYQAYTDRWWEPVVNRNDWAGKGDNTPIRYLAVKVNKGKIRGRVYTEASGWLPYLTFSDSYNLNDLDYGVLGDGSPIQAVELYYYTPEGYGYKKVHYKVSSQESKEYYSVQIDNETGSGMDGYAGKIGTFVDKFQAWIE